MTAILIMALVIVTSIVGAGILVWHLCADSLDPTNLKRTAKGRRHGDR